MAHVEKRTRNGKTTYRVHYIDPSGARKSEVYARSGDADKRVIDIEHSKLRGNYIDPALGKVTFNEYADEWVKTKTVARSTMENIEGRLNKWARPFFGTMQLGQVKPETARKFKAHILNNGRAPSTVTAIMNTTSQIFEQAVDDDLIARNPFATVPRPEDREHAEQRYLTAVQVDQFAAAFTDPRYRPAVYLASYGGLRAGELWGLKVAHVNVLARTVEVAVSASEAGGWHIGPTKTGKRRTIVVPRFVATMLGEHIGNYPSPSGYVFTAAEGGPVHHRNFKRRHCYPACVAAGFGERVRDEEGKQHYEGLRFHDTRHTCAAFLIATGSSLQEVKAHLGHSSIRVTSDRYGHLFPEAKEAMADRLDAHYLDRVNPPGTPRNENVQSLNANQRP